MTGRADERSGLSLLERGIEAASRAALQVTVGRAVIGGAALAANLPGRDERANLFQRDSLTFPLDLITDFNKYYMSLRFVKYTKRAISDRKRITNDGVIHLPIPNQLNDTTSLSYPNVELGPLMGSFVEAAGSSTSTPLERATMGFEGAAAAASQLITGLPGGNEILNASSAITGLAINPFTTVVFKGPQFKTHNFSWKFFPKSKQESDRLTEIVQTIKYHILPGLLTSSGVMFEYPEMVLINISPSEENLYKFKPCIIKSLNVNYAPSGGPSFFRNSLAAPTGIELKMELQEIEYFTKMDIDPRATPGSPSESLVGRILPNIPGFSGLFGR